MTAYVRFSIHSIYKLIKKKLLTPPFFSLKQQILMLLCLAI